MISNPEHRLMNINLLHIPIMKSKCFVNEQFEITKFQNTALFKSIKSCFEFLLNLLSVKKLPNQMK